MGTMQQESAGKLYFTDLEVWFIGNVDDVFVSF